jgi:acetyltransferase
LVRICFNDFDREIALVAEYGDSKTGRRQIIGVARLSKARGLNEAEFAMIIGDPWQKHGLGTEMLKRLIQIGKNEKLKRITAEIMSDNAGMQRVSRKVGFKIIREAGGPDLKAEYVFRS